MKTRLQARCDFHPVVAPDLIVRDGRSRYNPVSAYIEPRVRDGQSGYDPGYRFLPYP